MNVGKMAAVAVAAILLAAGAVQAITIETVPVGNPGNAADTAAHSGNAAGQGAVSYTYSIGKYEVTAGQYAAFLNAVAKTDTYGLYNTSMDIESFGCQITRHGSSGSYTYDFSGRPSGTEADWVNRPVNYVSWGDSARFANWLHNGQPTAAQGLTTTEDGAYYLNGATSSSALMAVNRETDWKWALTSEDEWYKAAYYKGSGTNAGYWDYPTKSNTPPSNVGSDGYTDPGNHANYYGSGYMIGSPYYRTNVGEFENSASAYGTFDQGGNVWEWIEAHISGSYRGWRGGSFYSYGGFFLLASSRSISDYGPTYEYSDIGFRVSEVPEPGSAALLVFGGLALLRRSGKK